MLTYEKILSVFEAYMAEDSDYDVVLTKLGYAVINWEDAHGKYGNAECYPTPKQFLEKMLEAYREYNEYSMLEHSGDTERELTPEEEKKLDEMCAAMRAKCR